MKIATIADIHLHNFTDFATDVVVSWSCQEKKFIKSNEGTTVSSRLLDNLTALVQLRENLVAEGIKVLLIGGDIFHKRGAVNTTVYNTAYEVLKSFRDDGITVISIPGNHDQVDHSDNPTDSLVPFQEIMTLVREPGCVDVGDVRVCCVPYRHNKKLVVEAINRFSKDDHKKKILLAHLGVTGAYVGKSHYSMTDEYSLTELKPKNFKYVVLGHYHKPQVLDKNVFYCGSPVQTNFNDEGGKHGYTIIDTDKSGYLDQVELTAPRFVTLSVEDYNSKKYQEGDFIRILAKPEEAERIVDGSDNNVRVEVEKEYVKDSRSEVNIVMGWEEIITTYAKERNPEATTAGLEIFNALKEMI